MSAPIDVEACEALAIRVSGGDRGAWPALLERLWPAWAVMVRSSRAMGALARDDDHVHEVMTVLAAKLGADGRRGVDRYLSWRVRHPAKSFLDWTRIVTANAVRDYVRQKTGAGLDPVAAEDPAVKKLLRDFVTSPAVDELGQRPPVTAAQMAQQLVAYAEAHLPRDQVRALGSWLEGATFEEIEEEFGLPGAGAGKRLVRAAVAALRRQFGAA